jgi:hypothetical protein
MRGLPVFAATATFTLHGTDEQPVPASLTLGDR